MNLKSFGGKGGQVIRIFVTYRSRNEWRGNCTNNENNSNFNRLVTRESYRTSKQVI